MDITLLILCVALFFSALFVLCKPQAQKNEVYHSKALPGTALLASAAGCAVSLLSLLQGTSNIASALSAVFLLLGIALLTAYCNQRILYTEDAFEVRSFFHHNKNYRMAEAVGITIGRTTTLLHMASGKKVHIDTHGKNAGHFLEAVESCCIEHGNGTALVDIPPRLFRGYLQNPGNFVGLFCIVGCFLLAANVFSLALYFRFAAPPEAPCLLQFNEFSASVDDNTLMIHAGQQEQLLFVSIYFDEVLEAKKLSQQTFLAELNKQSVIGVLVEEAALSGGHKFIRIYRLTGDGGTVLLQHEDITKGYQASALQGLYMCVVILSLFAVFVVFFCVIVSNAPKHPKLVRLLVKESWLNF